MTSPSDEVPSEDWAEQNVNAEPTEIQPEPAAVQTGTTSEEVDDADRQEQETTVYTGEDERRG